MLSSKQWNNKKSDIKLVYLYSTMKITHGPINFKLYRRSLQAVFWAHCMRPYRSFCFCIYRCVHSYTHSAWPPHMIMIQTTCSHYRVSYIITCNPDTDTCSSQYRRLRNPIGVSHNAVCKFWKTHLATGVLQRKIWTSPNHVVISFYSFCNGICHGTVRPNVQNQ